MTPRYGDPREPGRRYRRRAGAYAILLREARVLLTHQSDPHDEFQLPGGGIEPGESPIRALHREVLEETGWRIAPQRRLGAFRRYTFMPEYDLWAEKLCIIYLARPVRRLSPPSEPGHSVHWAAPLQAARMVGNPGDAAMIRAALRALLV
ncbi:MAG: 8-oxo-dGTP diphosphatase [Rhodobacteraceae bacterium HLUCCA12]|nr:MAG: 8-oxo-dGTP diphosphatase [Rhodobacteraceae bacterium HLUCCA12]